MKAIPICKGPGKEEGCQLEMLCCFARSKGQHLERHGEIREHHHLPALVFSKHLEFVSDNEGETTQKDTKRSPSHFNT